MMASRILGAFGITGEHEREDFPVLFPYQRALLRIAEHSSHRAFQMRPLRRDRLLDRAVTGQTIQRPVKIDVGLDEGEDRSIGRQLKASRKSPLGGLAQRRSGLSPRNALGTQPRRQPIECAANLIKFVNPLWVDPGNYQTAPTRFLDQLLLLE